MCKQAESKLYRFNPLPDLDNANVGTYARRILKDTEDQRVQKRSEVQKIFIKYVRLRAGCRDAYALQQPVFWCINTKNLWKEIFFT